MRLLPSIIPAIALATALLCEGVHAQTPTVPEPERSALIALYHSTDGADWMTPTNWLDPEKSLDQWYGVQVEGGHVVALNLSNNGLNGTIAPELENLENLRALRLGGNQLTGTIPKQLGNLLNLQILSLEVNQLTGSLPGELGQLEDLEELYLYSNDLEGPLPPELGGLAKMRILHAYKNQLTGLIPKEWGAMTALETLVLSYNQLDGPLPKELGDLANLEQLYLDHNQIDGSLPPETGNLEKLRIFSIQSNQLNGPIPATLGRLSALETLTLSGNALEGSIPEGLGQLVNLKTLALSNNRLTGTIPSSLSTLSALETLRLADNQLSGVLSPQLGDLARLYFLDLSGNLFRSPIPDAWSGMTNLRELRLARNRFNTELPHAVDGMTRLQTLDLSRNYFWGPIPDAWTSLQELRRLDLSGNRLSGSLPSDLGALQQLEYLGLSGNVLSGTIPASIGQLENLQQCSLGGNRLSGSIPPEIGNASALVTLSLNDNDLGGALPGTITKLQNLRRLSLRKNGLSGKLPSDLGKLTSLSFLDLAANHFSGSIPASIESLDRLEFLDLSQNADTSGAGFSGNLPTALWNLSRLRYVDLSKNRLAGSIAPAVGALANLEQLDVSRNLLSGAVPPELAALPQLRGLGLEGNQFTGDLPGGLAGVLKGTVVDLVGNRFEGPVPADLLEKANLKALVLDGNQFDSLPAELPAADSLEILSLGHNRIGPDVASGLFGRLPKLRILNLESNRLTGFPDLAPNVLLEVLSVADNLIDQAFPQELTGLTRLRILSIRGNRIRGPIPPGILNLQQLQDGSSDFRRNLIQTSDPAVDRFVTSKQSGGAWKLEWVFPYYSENTGSPWKFTSFGFTNTSTESALLVEQFDPAGVLMHESEKVLGAGAQSAQLGREFWQCGSGSTGPDCIPPGAAAQQLDGWVRVTLGSPDVRGFFLFSNGSSMMDGGLPTLQPAQHLVFTTIPAMLEGQAVETRIHLVNPNGDPVGLDLQLHDETGTLIAETRQDLNALSSLRGSIGELLGSNPQGGAYLVVDVTGGPGIAGFETMSVDPPGTLLGLSPWTDLTATHLYSAQVAYIPKVLTTSLHLVNRAETKAGVELTLYDGTGHATGSSQLNLEPGASWSADLQDVFALASTTVGSLAVECDTPGVIGDILFVNANLVYGAAVQLDTSPATRAVFSQVANIGRFFTGLALFNPGQAATNLTLQVFTSAGVLAGRKDLSLDPFARVSANLSELVTESAQQTGGYIQLDSDHPIVAQEIFTQADTMYVAVPPSK